VAYDIGPTFINHHFQQIMIQQMLIDRQLGEEQLRIQRQEMEYREAERKQREREYEAEQRRREEKEDQAALQKKEERKPPPVLDNSIRPILLRAHPDYEEIIKTKEYREWLIKQSPAVVVAGASSNDPKI
jgi:hypothetical protein